VFHGKYSVSFGKYLKISNGIVVEIIPAWDNANESLINLALSLVGIAYDK
jgi:hypothetical protein